MAEIRLHLKVSCGWGRAEQWTSEILSTLPVSVKNEVILRSCGKLKGDLQKIVTN